MHGFRERFVAAYDHPGWLYGLNPGLERLALLALDLISFEWVWLLCLVDVDHLSIMLCPRKMRTYHPSLDAPSKCYASLGVL